MWSLFSCLQVTKIKVFSVIFFHMPVLLAGIISGPAVLPCSSTDCENAPRGTGVRALLCQGCVCWSWLCISEQALTSWENGQIPAELVNKTWREATKFWREKIFWKCTLGFPCCWQPGGTGRHSCRWVWPLLQAQLRWEKGFGLLAWQSSIRVFQWWPGAAILQQQWPFPYCVIWGKKRNEKEKTQHKYDWVIKCRWSLGVNKCPVIHIKKMHTY